MKLVSIILMFLFSYQSVYAEGLRYVPEEGAIDIGIFSQIESIEESTLILKVSSVNLPKKIEGIGFSLTFDKDYIKYLDYELLIKDEDFIVLNNVNDGVMVFALSSKNHEKINVEKDIINVKFKILKNGNNKIKFDDIYVLEEENNILNKSYIKYIGGTIYSDINLPVSGFFDIKITPLIFFKYGIGVILFFTIMIYILKKIRDKRLCFKRMH